MEKKTSKAKIIITVVVLVSTLAFVGFGTYAWYTLGTKATMSGMVVSMPRNGDEWPFEFIEQRTYDEWATIGQVMDAYNHNEDDGWSKGITLSMVKYIDENGNEAEKTADDCYKLRPISTSDLQSWYLPNYNGRGDVSYLVNAPLNTVGNINRYRPTASEADKDIPSNYVYYYDIWVRTLSDKLDYDLHLNNPYSAEEADPDKYQEYYFGTYVLPGLVKDATGRTTISETGYDMSTCMRIGFQIYEQHSEDIADETLGDFWIYEPNCDARAEYFTHYSGNGSNYNMQRNYVYVLGEDGNNKTVSSQLTQPRNEDVQTLLPYGVLDETFQQFKSVDDRTIKQLQSKWKTGIDLDNLGPRGLDSSYVGQFGAFLSEETGDTSLTGIDTPSFLTVTKGQPEHIRVFIWMEGQDIDCWNSSLQGSLKIGLEFRGDGHAK